MDREEVGMMCRVGETRDGARGRWPTSFSVRSFAQAVMNLFIKSDNEFETIKTEFMRKKREDAGTMMDVEVEGDRWTKASALKF